MKHPIINPKNLTFIILGKTGNPAPAFSSTCSFAHFIPVRLKNFLWRLFYVTSRSKRHEQSEFGLNKNWWSNKNCFNDLTDSFSFKTALKPDGSRHWYSDNVFKAAYLSRLFEFRHYAILIDFGKNQTISLIKNKLRNTKPFVNSVTTLQCSM